MSDKRYYNVAGFSFGVESPEEGFLDSMTNLAPFKSEMGSGEHVFDLEIVERVPIQMPATTRDLFYLKKKKKKMGHILDY